MDVLVQVAIGLVTAVIGLIAGRIWEEQSCYASTATYGPYSGVTIRYKLSYQMWRYRTSSSSRWMAAR